MISGSRPTEEVTEESDKKEEESDDDDSRKSKSASPPSPPPAPKAVPEEFTEEEEEEEEEFEEKKEEELEREVPSPKLNKGRRNRTANRSTERNKKDIREQEEERDERVPAMPVEPEEEKKEGLTEKRTPMGGRHQAAERRQRGFRRGGARLSLTPLSGHAEKRVSPVPPRKGTQEWTEQEWSRAERRRGQGKGQFSFSPECSNYLLKNYRSFPKKRPGRFIGK